MEPREGRDDGMQGVGKVVVLLVLWKARLAFGPDMEW